MGESFPGALREQDGLMTAAGSRHMRRRHDASHSRSRDFFGEPDWPQRSPPRADIQWACIEETSSNPDFPLGVGAGIDFGEAASVNDGYHGSAINMAARLCAAASAGQILVTGTVAESAHHISELVVEPRATLPLKGFDEAVQVFEASSRRAAAVLTADGAASAAPLPLELDEVTPLAGRERAWLGPCGASRGSPDEMGYEP
jgi:hypothetical protein